MARNGKEIYDDISCSLLELYKKTNADKVIIGVSGGVDSAVVAALSVKVLGADKVMLYFMPYLTTTLEARKDAASVATKLGVRLNIVDISGAVDKLAVDIEENDPLRKGNMMSRMRMIILFNMASKFKGIVLGTSNKTEFLLGYGTWYGDMASSINVLGSLYKFEVYELARYLEVPENIITKSPSADLWLGQTDEDELGFSYKDADEFLKSILEDKLSRSEIEAKFSRDFIKRIVARILGNSFKRNMPQVCSSSGEHYADYNKIFTEYV